jgi:hypothetical protein
LSSLTAADIRSLAVDARRSVDTVDGELAWWKATIVVTGELRRCHRTREAGLVAHQAVVTVHAAAAREGIDDAERDAVTLVARAAADAARALVAESAATRDHSAAVLTGWLRTLAVAA